MNSFEHRKFAVIQLLEKVAAGTMPRPDDKEGDPTRFISPLEIDQGFPMAPPGEPSWSEVRRAAVRDSNDQDYAAGRPFLSAVILDSEFSPRMSFFDEIERLRGVRVLPEEREEVHKREYLAAIEYPWATIGRWRVTRR